MPDLNGISYDALLDGVGVFLDYSKQPPDQLAPLSPIKQDTGNADEIRPEYGYTWAQGDFRGGGSQRFRNRPNADKTAFWDSQKIDITSEGALAPAHDVTTVGPNTGGNSITALEQANSRVFVAAGFNVYNSSTNDLTVGPVWNTETPLAATTVNDLAASGTELYAALNSTAAPLYKRDSAGTWATTTVTLDGATRTAVKCFWLKERLLVVARKAGVGDSLYEVSGTTATLVDATLSLGWTIEYVFEAGAFIYACAVNLNGNKSRVITYGSNAALAGLEKKATAVDMPRGEFAYCGIGYLGPVFLGGGKRTGANGVIPLLYRAEQGADGTLTLIKLADWQGPAPDSELGSYPVQAVTAWGQRVAFGVGYAPNLLGLYYGNVTTYDLAHDALLSAVTFNTSGPPVDITVYKNQTLIPDGSSLYGVTINKAARPSFAVDHPQLVTSFSDFGNAGLKLWDTVSIGHPALPTGTQIDVYYSTSNPWDPPTWTLLGSSSTAGSVGKDFSLTNITSRFFGLKLHLLATTGSPVSVPSLTSLSVRAFPYHSGTTPEYVLQRFVRIEPEGVKGNGDLVLAEQDTTIIWKSLLDKGHKVVTLQEEDATWSGQIVDISSDRKGILGKGQVDETYELKITLLATRTA